MKDLSETRAKIDDIDARIAALLTERMACSREIAAAKKESGAPVSDRRREREILARVSQLAGPEDVTYIQSVYETIFAVSRACQARILDEDAPLRRQIEEARRNAAESFPHSAVVACPGIEGANSQLAADRLFRNPSILYFDRFEGVFSAVSSGLCRYGVLPIENSTAGSVNEVYDLMRKNKFYIVRAIKYKVRHCLMAKPGVELSEITEIRSHEQALAQCSAYLSKRKDVRLTACENTAVAARSVAESAERGVAALCSPECAALYGLHVLADDVMNSEDNYTRFICISKSLEIYPGADKLSLMMLLPHRPGSLGEVISKFSALGLNLTKLESRPIAGRDFEFTFYFDVKADVASADVTALLCEFAQEIDGFTYLGSYIEEV
ncbi:MAG: bifunctional chorismate mutase/prephenate dehydratase [Oscillospiraceae bacterium]|jgi:chorismate mutase/prephenate dehydratase